MQSTFPLTSSWELTSICLQSNSRRTTSKCPFCEAQLSAVLPSYIFFLPSTKFSFKNTLKKSREENLEMECDAINISTDLILRININLFAVQQSIDHIQMFISWSPTQCGISILHFLLIPSTKFSFKNTLKKSREDNLEMECDAINISTDVGLHIDCNLFAVQQSIDHIQMSLRWSGNQCGISILHFLPSTKFSFKNTFKKK